MAALRSLQLRISTPTEPIVAGRGFYQLEEEELYVQVGPFGPERRFFSYLESDIVRLDLDRGGRLIFVEVTVPRRHWPATPALSPPFVIEPADIRWLDFRQRIAPPRLTSNRSRTVLKLTFSASDPTRSYYLADDVILQVSDSGELHAVWVNNIVDDLAGQEIAEFRRSLRPVLAVCKPEPVHP